MSNEKVIIDIAKDGGTTVSVDGVKGEQCSTMSSGIIRALGGNVISDTPTDEMYEHPTPGQEVYQ